MTVARAMFALVWSPDGRLFAVGGLDDTRSATSSVEMLDCPWDTEGETGDAWMPVAPMNRSRQFPGACFFEGKIFVAGGKGEKSVECFVMPSMDLPSGQWTMVQPMKRKSNLQGLLPFNGGLLIIGELNFLLQFFPLERNVSVYFNIISSISRLLTLCTNYNYTTKTT